MSSSGGINSADGLYFQIVCDPGHERTTRELQQLPRESREGVWADISGEVGKQQQPQQQASNGALHLKREGIGERISQEVHEKLQLMDIEVVKARQHDPAAKFLECEKAHDRDLRILFLRAEDMNPPKAAQRMIRHFELKATLFGRDSLDRDIRLADLSEDDIESLECGSLQFLPRADRHGRYVFVSRYINNVYKEKENMLRALWYMMMSVASPKNNGIVIVGYEVGGEYVPMDYELIRRIFKLVRTLPVRISASHSCYNASPMHKAVDLIVHMVSAFARLRMRMHIGSHQECRYRLMTMGIPIDYLPVTLDGVLRTENHRRWLEYRVRLEQATSSAPLPPAAQYAQNPPQAPQDYVKANGLHVVEDEDDDMEL